MKKLIMGGIYEVEWIDHDQVESKSSKDAVTEELCILKTYGVYIGECPTHYVFAYNYANPTSGNNDNMRIFKKGIKKIRKLR